MVGAIPYIRLRGMHIDRTVGIRPITRTANSYSCMYLHLQSFLHYILYLQLPKVYINDSPYSPLPLCLGPFYMLCCLNWHNSLANSRSLELFIFPLNVLLWAFSADGVRISSHNQGWVGAVIGIKILETPVGYNDSE